MSSLDSLHTNIQDQVWVVSGGASGIGAATVELARSRGAAVEVVDLVGRPAVDLRDPSAVAQFGHDFAVRHERCDVLVNCAGVAMIGDAASCSLEEWDLTFDVNVRGSWLLSRALWDLLTPGGCIINVASGAGLRAVPRMAAYVSSKHALIGLTRSMALDLAPRQVRVVALAPGPVSGDLHRTVQEASRADAPLSSPSTDTRLLPGTAEATDLAQTIAFLASSAATYLTGATIAVDGGRTMH